MHDSLSQRKDSAEYVVPLHKGLHLLWADWGLGLLESPIGLKWRGQLPLELMLMLWSDCFALKVQFAEILVMHLLHCYLPLLSEFVVLLTWSLFESPPIHGGGKQHSTHWMELHIDEENKNQHFQCGNANQEWNFFEVSQVITWRKGVSAWCQRRRRRKHKNLSLTDLPDCNMEMLFLLCCCRFLCSHHHLIWHIASVIHISFLSFPIPAFPISSTPIVAAVTLG